MKSVGHLLDINYEEEQEGGQGGLFAVADETRQPGRHLVLTHLTNKGRPTCLPVQLSSYLSFPPAGQQKMYTWTHMRPINARAF